MIRAALAILLLACLPAQARDLGQWDGADKATRDWFQAQVNQKGEACCDTADGRRVEDPDWRVEGSGYAVNLGTGFQPVDPALIVRGTNRMGYAIAWIYPVGTRTLRCFLPGPTG